MLFINPPIETPLTTPFILIKIQAEKPFVLPVKVLIPDKLIPLIFMSCPPIPPADIEIPFILYLPDL